MGTAHPGRDLGTTTRSGLKSRHEEFATGKVIGLGYYRELRHLVTTSRRMALGRIGTPGNTHRLSTACMEIKRAGTLKVSKNTSAAFSRFLLGLSGASVRRTGCCKRWQLWVCARTVCWNLKGSFQSQPRCKHCGYSPLSFLVGISLYGTYSFKEPALSGRLSSATLDYCTHI